MAKRIFCFFLMLPMIVSAQSPGWTVLSSGTSQHLIGISCPSANTAFVCGNGGTILKTTNGGLNWHPQSSGTSQSLAVIKFVDPLRGFAVGDMGAALKTSDGGTTWLPMPVTTQYLRDIFLVDSDTLYLSGGNSGSLGSIFKSTDGGATWTDLGIGAPNIIYNVTFTDPAHGYALEYDGHLYSTSDYGQSWTMTIAGYSYSPADMFNLDASNFLSCCGSGKILKSTDSGASWADVYSGSNWLSSVDFPGMSKGWVVGGNVASNTGCILESSDGGDTWNISYPATPRLVRLCMINELNGFAVGLNGTILRYRSQSAGLVDESAGNALQFSPNPVSTRVTVSGDISFPAKAEIWDAAGQVLRRTEMSADRSIDVSGLPAGLYFITLRAAKGCSVGKMVIE